MKKGLLALVTFLAVGLTANAGTAAMFSYDHQEAEMSMAQLDRLEDYVNAHEGITYAEVAATQGELVKNISDQPSISIGDSKRNRVLGIPSFLWGCVFGVAGLAVVYFVAEDKEETKQALWGCVASTVVGIVLYIILFATAASTVASASTI